MHFFREEIRHTDTNSKLLHSGYIYSSETIIEISITQISHKHSYHKGGNRYEYITHESVHQSSGQTRSTISKRIDTSARQKNKYTS